MEVCLDAPRGASARIDLFGAHLTSWRTVDGQERLFMSSRSARDGSAAIRGGVPVIFPQFATRGPGQRHGFARTATWRQVDQGTTWVELELAPSDLTPQAAQAWPHAFLLRLRVALLGNALALRYTVRNTGAHAFDFAAALHSYFALEEFAHSTLVGLPDKEELHFGGMLDEIHPASPTLRLRTGAGTLLLEQQGFSEWVVWNPGAEGAAALADMADDDYRRFVCIEPARVNQQPLAAGAEWSGQCVLSLIP